MEDQQQRLWITADEGISVLSTETMTFRNYREEDGLQGNQFAMGFYENPTSGEFYFGRLEDAKY